MNKFTHKLAGRVLKIVEEIKEEGLQNKIDNYLELLHMYGFNLPSQYLDKIEGYKGLFELRPHFHNIEFRMIFFWQGNTAMIIHAFYERGSKKKNQREYDTADKIRNNLK